MDVSSGHVTAGREEEIESEQCTMGLVTGRLNDDALAADGVVEYASGEACVGHLATVIQRPCTRPELQVSGRRRCVANLSQSGPAHASRISSAAPEWVSMARRTSPAAS